jgi:IPT/TIG domain
MHNNNRWCTPRWLVALCAFALTPAAALADPSISGFSANPVPLNSYLTIYGSGFGDAQGRSYVLIGGNPVPVQAWSAVAIHVFVNPLLNSTAPLALDTAYPVQVVVPAADHPNSNTLNLTLSSGPPLSYSNDVVDQPKLSDQPSVIGFQSTTFCPGNTVAIYGAGFGFDQGSGYISITVPLLDAQGTPFTQEFAIPVLAWSENAIYALLSLPAGAQFGTYTLTVQRGNGKTASGSFTVGACP